MKDDDRNSDLVRAIEELLPKASARKVDRLRCLIKVWHWKAELCHRGYVARKVGRFWVIEKKPDAQEAPEVRLPPDV